MTEFLTVIGGAFGIAGISMIVSFIFIETYFWRKRRYINDVIKQIWDIKRGEGNKAFPISTERPWDCKGSQ